MAVAKPKKRGVIFGADSVRLILAGKKTQTRRVIKGVPENARHGEFAAPFGEEHKGWTGGVFFEGANVNSPGVGSIRCPYGKPGGRLWVRETYFVATGPADGSPPSLDNSLVQWKADADPGLLKVAAEHKLWQTPLFMPRWASRITLEITDVRVERLQDISEEDAIAEGCSATKLSRFISADEHESAREQFARVWDDLNARRGYPWADSPWVWVVAFRVVS